MSINNASLKDVLSAMQASLLAKFPEIYREKLKRYTTEELFYMYKLVTYKPGARKYREVFTNSDMFLMGVKQTFFRWLKDELCGCSKNGYTKNRHAEDIVYRPCPHGINPSMWNKLGSKFQSQWNTWLTSMVQDKANALLSEQLSRAKVELNNKFRLVS